MRLRRIDNVTLISFQAHKSDPLGAEHHLRLLAVGAVALARYRETLDGMLARRNGSQSMLESAPFARLPTP
jgi:phosphatidylglycerophosphate synthase